MVKTADKKFKNKQKERLKLSRTSSPSSSSSHASFLARKRSNRLSSSAQKQSTTLINHKQDDNLSIYSREEDDDDAKSEESESDFVQYKYTPQKRGRKPKKKVSKMIMDSSEDDREEDEESESEREEPNESKLSLNNQTQMNKFTQITFVGKKYTLDTFEPMDLISDEQIVSNKNFIVNKQQIAQQAPELPKVNVETKTEYPSSLVEYKLPTNLIKYVETTAEELDEEVEYDMDEEDTMWLETMNEQRLREDNIDEKITQEQFEILMDRLEKESYFQSSGHHHKLSSSLNQSNNQSHNSAESSLNHTRNDSSNEDALCCICLDGECLNTNAILFCDMCNLAVHQECYGVPYIPEGQWLCRRCIQSPSSAVNCILCPNRYGAFKQTDRGLWCHVICAIWIPEVHFANTVFLEPVIGIENIDRARWKLMCYICRKKNAGACIQCDKNNCYTAFHVTCAQQAGLYMNINEEPVTAEKHPRKKNNKNRQKTNQSMNTSGGVELRRRAYCDIHTPIETLSPRTRKTIQSAYSGVECDEAMKRAQRMRMKKARKILAERRNAPPVVCMPVIPKERCDEILDKYLSIDQKEKFFARLMNYWTLKRYSRNGVPMLRRLQQAPGIKKKDVSTTSAHHHNQTEKLEDQAEVKLKLKEQLAYWKKMRRDLETTRLLMELIRKRERMKRELIRIEQLKAVYDINALNGVFLQRILDILRDFDRREIFHEPVDLVEVPTYGEVIKSPMDFSTMQAKMNRIEYENLNQFEADFELIISNCVKFNQKNSHYYKAAVKLKEQASNVLKQAKRLYAANFENNIDAKSAAEAVATNVLSVKENDLDSSTNFANTSSSNYNNNNDLSFDKLHNKKKMKK